MPGTGALLLLVFASLVVVLLLVFLQLTRLGFLIRSTIPDRPRRRMFIASVSFLITFILVIIFKNSFNIMTFVSAFFLLVIAAANMVVLASCIRRGISC